MKTVEAIYIIRDVATGKLVGFNNKVAWISSGAAKSAFMVQEAYRRSLKKFDDQSEFVVERLDLTKE